MILWMKGYHLKQSLKEEERAGKAYILFKGSARLHGQSTLGGGRRGESLLDLSILGSQ